MTKPAPVANEHCHTGENPLWHPGERAVYWTDIPAGKLFRYDPATNSHRTVYEGEPVGGFTLQSDGSLLLFRVSDLARLDLASGAVTIIRGFSDEGMERFNDVMVDPEGRVFAGTIGTTDEGGGVYRVDTDGTITKLFAGTRCSNGMGFSPDGKTLYWTDSSAGVIYRFPYDRPTGQLGDREVVHRAGPVDGIPDGLVVDEKGHLWSARWDGHCVLHIDPDGTVCARHPLPVAKVSSLCFAGDNLDTFYITTAGGSPGATTDDGALFRFDPGIRGPDRFRSRICL